MEHRITGHRPPVEVPDSRLQWATAWIGGYRWRGACSCGAPIDNDDETRKPPSGLSRTYQSAWCRQTGQTVARRWGWTGIHPFEGDTADRDRHEERTASAR